MRFTGFTLMQDGQAVGSSADVEQAAVTAARRAAAAGMPVTVTAHADGGGTRQAVFNPDGTNEGIWNIDKRHALSPDPGRTYTNRGGGEYLCLGRVAGPCAAYFNSRGGSSDTAAVFRNIETGISGCADVMSGIRGRWAVLV